VTTSFLNGRILFWHWTILPER